MNKETVFNYGKYLFGVCGGLVSGLLFSKAAYHKGQADAYGKIADDLEGLNKEIEEKIADNKEESQK
jgi:hypothetical protein